MKALKQIALKLFLLTIFIQFTPEISLSQPPPWAPAHGYRAKTTYIYFPQHNFYFDLNRRVYFIWVTNRWVTYTVLPARYVRLNLRNATQIELDLVSKYPYYHNSDHRTKYVKVKSKPAPAKAKPAPGKSKPAPAVMKNKGNPNQPNPGKGKPAPNPGQGKGQGHGKGKGKG